MFIAAALAGTIVFAMLLLGGVALFSEIEFRRNGFTPKD